MSKITITVSGETGSGKSAIAGEIEIALKAIGVPVEWKDADREHWTHGNEYWIDLYKPEVTIIEQNIVDGIPRGGHLRERLARMLNSTTDQVVKNDIRDLLLSGAVPHSS